MKKLRLAGIGSYEAANDFLEAVYMADHNRRFGREPSSETDFHRKRPGKSELDAVFCLEQERVLGLDWVVSYESRLLQAERQSQHHAPARSKVLVRENEQGELHLEYRGRRLSFTEIARRPIREPASGGVSPASRRHTAPAENHPWRQSYKPAAAQAKAG